MKQEGQSATAGIPVLQGREDVNTSKTGKVRELALGLNTQDCVN
ncbi:hypothetical protein [Nonomuraea mesophila]|nr:hypothetical protein [Nonomuraea mesophila]